MLEDTVAKYTVQIVQDGSTAPAVQEFNNLRAAAQNAASGTTTATHSLTAFRESGRLASDSLREVSGAAILLGGTHFPALAASAMEVQAGFGAVRAAAIVTGVGLGTLIEVIGGIGLAIGAGFELWEVFGNHIETAAEKAKKLADGLTGLKGIIPELFELQNQYPLNFAIGGLPGNAATINSPEDAAKWMNNAQGNPDPQSIARFQKALSQSGYLINTGTDDKPNYEVDPRIIAAQKLDELTKQITQDSLTGYDKEKAAADDLFQKQVDQARQLAAIAGNKATPGAEQSSEDAALKTHNITIQTAQLNHELDDEINFYKQISDELGNEIALSKQLADDRNKALAIQDEWMKAGPTDGLDPTAHAGEGGGNDTNTFSDQINAQLLSVQQMGVKTADDLSSGFADAFTSFIDGSKTAKEAFEEFAASFLQDISKMLAQQALLNLFGQSGSGGSGGSGIFGSLSSLFGGGAAAGAGAAGAGAGLFDDAGSALAGFAANGGIFPRMMADGGFAGMFSSATYFPRFNVVGGEAGTEMLAALAKPTFRSIGGIDSIVGNAGSNRLAIANADEMERRAGGVGGHIHIQIDHTPETQARIVSQAIDGAEVRVTKSMTRNSKFRQAVRSGTTT